VNLSIRVSGQVNVGIAVDAWVVLDTVIGTLRDGEEALIAHRKV
jgi:hypothetical protein